MSLRHFAAALGAATLLGATLSVTSMAQQQPQRQAPAAQQRQAPAAAPAAPAQPPVTPAQLLLAKELIDLKGAAAAYDPLVNGVIQYHRNFFMQTNPNLARDLDAVAQKLAADFAPRKAEMQQELTRIYAAHFTEQELKDALAFYKTPLGRKLISEEPKALEESMKAADDWSRRLAAEVDAKFRAEMQRRGHNLI
jgi:uncharacterized protein